jgi:predicted DNA-binding protein (MmcQ/YjbR family)
MNKKSWITIRLDNSVDNSFIYKYIDISYELSVKK